MMGNAPARIWIDGAVKGNKWHPNKDDCTLSGVATVEYIRADLAPAPRWQPISTAPKDGTEICAWVGSGYIGGWLQVKWHKHNGLAAWRDWDMDVWHPAHWMPLPAPPEAS